MPEGEWLTGPIHLRDNVNLYLAENAILRFIDTPSRYLPAVMTSWEGMECYNYSPLIYALECKNVAITGTGLLSPKMDCWKKQKLYILINTSIRSTQSVTKKYSTI